MQIYFKKSCRTLVTKFADIRFYGFLVPKQSGSDVHVWFQCLGIHWLWCVGFIAASLDARHLADCTILGSASLCWHLAAPLTVLPESQMILAKWFRVISLWMLAAGVEAVLWLTRIPTICKATVAVHVEYFAEWERASKSVKICLLRK